MFSSQYIVGRLFNSYLLFQEIGDTRNINPLILYNQPSFEKEKVQPKNVSKQASS